MTTELVPRVEVIPTWNRSRLYSMLAYGFRFPEPARYEAIQGGAVLGATRAAIVQAEAAAPTWSSTCGRSHARTIAAATTPGS